MGPPLAVLNQRGLICLLEVSLILFREKKKRKKTEHGETLCVGYSVVYVDRTSCGSPVQDHELKSDWHWLQSAVPVNHVLEPA